MNNLHSQRFGRLIVVCVTKKRANDYVMWLCRCDCGNLAYVRSSHLLSGRTKSCGCLRKEMSNLKSTFKHGDAPRGKPARLYNTWASMKYRCLNSNLPNYKYYGGKKISVCNEWRDSYTAFRDWALANGYEKNLTIDRINHKGNYEPSNCQWLTNSENVKKANKDRRIKKGGYDAKDKTQTL